MMRKQIFNIAVQFAQAVWSNILIDNRSSFFFTSSLIHALSKVIFLIKPKERLRSR